MPRRRFIMTVLFLMTILHAYVGVRLVPALPGAAAGTLAIWLAASCILIPLSMMSRRFESHAWMEKLAWPGLFAMGAFSSLLLGCLLRDVFLMLARMGGPLSLGLVRYSAEVAALLAIAVTLIGFVNARRRASVRQVDIPIEGLPAALEGFTIAQISDIHVGPTIRGPYVRRIVDAVNALDADVVAVTGDVIDGSVEALAAHAAPLADLRARYGVYLVTGNHEYYAGVSEWIVEFERLGMKVLLNTHEVIEHGGAPVVVAGVPDYSAHHFNPSHRSDPGKALAGAPGDAVRILLAHQPRTAESAEAAGFDLQLSGHTHGGQFFPWNFFVPLQQPYTAGLHKLHGMWIYISRGTGYWGPPKRFGAPSEITRLRLVAAV